VIAWSSSNSNLQKC